jgi:hypothetical protein
MAKKHIKFAVIFAVIFAAGFVAAYVLNTPTAAVTKGGGHTIYGFLNEITVEHCSAKTGECTKQTTHNVVTREGTNWTRDVVSGLGAPQGAFNRSNYNNWTFLELSAATSVGFGNASCVDVITGNGLDIKQATTIYRTNEGNFSMNASWTKTGGATTTVRQVCVSNNSASASSDLMAAALLSSAVNLETSDQLTVSYAIAFVNGTA